MKLSNRNDLINIMRLIEKLMANEIDLENDIPITIIDLLAELHSYIKKLSKEY